MNKNVFYVYLHRRASDNKVFYVGKGKGKRAYSTFGRNDRWSKTANKHGLIVEIVFDNLEEAEAFQIERDTILEMKYFEYPLVNMTDGGEGLSGFKWSEEQMKNHTSLKNIGRKHSLEEIEKRRASLMGHPTSDQTKEKIRLGNVAKSVFRFIVKSLLKKRIVHHRVLAKILNLPKTELYKKPDSYLGFSREQIEKSAALRRGKPAYNKGVPSPATQGNGNNCADKSIYQFKRISDGLVFIGTRYDLKDTFNLDIKELGKLFYLKNRVSSQGWSIIKEPNGTT